MSLGVGADSVALTASEFRLFLSVEILWLVSMDLGCMRLRR